MKVKPLRGGIIMDFNKKITILKKAGQIASNQKLASSTVTKKSKH